jgi:hypothetical protein
MKSPLELSGDFSVLLIITELVNKTAINVMSGNEAECK